MNKTSIALSLLCSVMFTQVAAENNYIECQRTKTTFKQFCKIKEQADTVSIDIANSFSLGNSSLDISNTLAEAAIISDNLNSEILVLNSLRPQLKVKSNWNGAAECLVSSLWADEIYIAINDRNSSMGMQPSRLYPGVDSQFINLALFNTDTFTPWSQTEAEASIRLSANLSVFNKSYSVERPLAFERIPLDCNLVLSDTSFYFDINSIHQDLASLKLKAEGIMHDLNQITDLESETFISEKANLKNIMLGAFAVTAIAKSQNPDYQNPEWMSSDSISSLY